MKNILRILVLGMVPMLTFGQQPKIYNLRPYDKKGINQFETKKEDSEFNGVKAKLGAGFTQQFQALEHKNDGSADLYRLDPGFGLAMANLYLDAQLADGILLNLTTYLSSKHHQETWVKGGFLQIDKIPFEGKLWSDLSKIITIKAGHFGINYGDAHFRRNDGGHTLYNPFVENYIMDAFATEIAGEVYVQKNGLIGMVGVSNGLINGGHQATLKPGSTTETYKRSPSLYAKVGVDKNLNEDTRVRLSGSVYYNNSQGRNTLYAGDRTGSQYFMALAPALTSGAASTPANNYATGRLNPNFTNQIAAFQLNGFAKYKGLEFFGTVETAKGKLHAETEKRKANQYAADLVYRFGKEENLFIGARVNTVTGQFLTNNSAEQSSTRTAVAAGWFIIPNVMMKAELMKQTYSDFPTGNVLSGGQFNGFVMQAVVGF
ncbi:MAG: hypothetical protein LRY55_03755 [Leadbetterella sp.]|nr:hypothetical protein [Leadbetterella sp.]